MRFSFEEMKRAAGCQQPARARIMRASILVLEHRRFQIAVPYPKLAAFQVWALIFWWLNACVSRSMRRGLFEKENEWPRKYWSWFWQVPC
jgi:hypothetical protein